MTDVLTQLRSGKLAGSTRLDLRCGLTEFPREIFELADSLEILNLTGNRLRELPDDFGRLHKLRIFFCSENEFTHLPAVLGACPQLEMVGFKANRIETVDAGAFSKSLRWLILTDNRVRELPAELGRCVRLQKLMLSGNRLTHLPEEMAQCTNLELLRLAANEFRELPPWLLTLPKLSWLAFAGNPCAVPADASAPQLVEVPWKTLHLEEKLGEGASGDIHRAVWQQGVTGKNEPVAVKMFKGAVTSDGLPACEMEACLAAGAHAHLIPIQGRVTGHPGGGEGLVMSLIDPAYATLAGPPSFASCTRDVYAEQARFSPAVVIAIAKGVASAAEHLHERGILHGDLYAHNVLWNPERPCLLGDFGAATFYGRSQQKVAPALRRIEVRAFGCLLGELLERGEWAEEQREMNEALWKLQRRCVDGEMRERPMFAEIVRDLESAGHALQEARARGV